MPQRLQLLSFHFELRTCAIMADGPIGPVTDKPFKACTALYDFPSESFRIFPDSPENGVYFYSFMVFCAMLIILYCLFRIRRQRTLFRRGQIRTMKQWLLPIYYSFLWFCVFIYAIKAIDIAILYLFFLNDFQTNMPFMLALFDAATFYTSSFWLFDVILLFLASNSHGTQTIRRAFWISTFIWMVSIIVVTIGIITPTNKGFLNFCAIYGLQCFLVIGVMSFMCLRAYPHHQYIWTLCLLFLIECSFRFAADYFRYQTYDAFCLMDIADYISSIVIPWVIIHTLRQDSKHWRFVIDDEHRTLLNLSMSPLNVQKVTLYTVALVVQKCLGSQCQFRILFTFT